MPIYNEMTINEFNREAKRLEREHWEIVFAQQLHAMRWFYEREYKFHPTRGWNYDFRIYCPRDNEIYFDDQCSILVDLQGGIWSGGAHVRGKGYQNDVDKMNAATALGWRVFWFTSDDIKSGKAIKFLEDEVWTINKQK